jgi:tetratricopeptide (TPR) repeat protein
VIGASPSRERVVDLVRRGDFVLFLGAGASIDSGAPPAQELSDEIGKAYFDFPPGSYPLAEMAGLVDAEDGRRHLNGWLGERLGQLEPSDTMLLIPEFCWKAIYTVNFDTLVEQAYARSPNPVQQLHPIYSDRDPLNFGADEVPLYKLHGCLTRANSDDGHLVLTEDDFAAVEKSRGRLFNRLVDHAADQPILYVGFRRADPDFARVLASVERAVGTLAGLSRSYALQPDFHEAERKRAELKKVTLLDSDAGCFFAHLDKSIPLPERDCREPARVSGIAVSRLAARRPHLRPDLLERLQRDYVVVDDGLQEEPSQVDVFFKGSPPTWGDISSRVDAGRDLEDRLVEAVLKDPAFDLGRPELHLVHAEAGAGKTTLLRRVGAELASTWDHVVLDLKPFGSLDLLDLEGLGRAVGERVYVLVDDVLRIGSELRAVMAGAHRADLKITVIGEARTNEWRENQDSLGLTVKEEFELEQLSKREIEAVLGALAAHGKLGYLEDATPEQRIEAFERRAEKQLLVALREATEGRAFDDIVVDEYERIPSADAKRAYLLIASLHRFNLFTRAAVLHRALDIPLAELGDRVFGPATKILIPRETPRDPEPFYTTRHPLIAEIVFDRAVHSERERLAFYVSLISQLDLGYKSDAETYRRLSRSLNRRLLRDFDSGQRRRELMKTIAALDPSDAFVHQHSAMMELRLGDVAAAARHIARAIELRPEDAAIRDTEGRIVLESARRESDTRRKPSKLQQAEEIFQRNIGRRPDEPYGYRHLAETHWEKYRAEADPQRRISHLVHAYRTLTDGLETCADTTMLLQYRAELEDNVGSHEVARDTLTEALNDRPGDVPLRVMAARLALGAGRGDEARRILEEGIRAAPDAWELHYRLALLLAERELADPQDVKRHFSAALTAPLRRFRPRLAYAAWLFGTGDYAEANEQFARLEELDLPGAQRRELHSYRFAGLDRQHHGRIVRLSYRSGHVDYDRGAQRIFFRAEEVDRASKPWLRPGQDVRYELAFNVRGPVARNLRRSAPGDPTARSRG